MSIASEISRIQNAKASLKTAINAKTDAQHQIDDETLDSYAGFVNSISAGEDVTAEVQEQNGLVDEIEDVLAGQSTGYANVSDTTATAGDVAEGKYFYNSQGVKTEGTGQMEQEDIYVSPSWYPDIKTIIQNAPDITVNGTTYYPMFIMLFDNTLPTTPFYRQSSSTISDINYNFATGCYAVLCSDDCDKDISNASESTLTLGQTIQHTWDSTKDYIDPTGESNYNVRWAIAYNNNKTNSFEVYLCGKCDAIEIIIRQGNMNIYTSSNNGNVIYDKLTYFEMLDTSNFTNSKLTGPNNFYRRTKLRTIILSNQISQIGGDWMMSYLPSLTKLTLPSSFVLQGSTANHTMSYMFSNIGIKNLDFSGFTNYTSNITSAVTIPGKELTFNDAITSLNIPLGGSFTKITLPSGLQSWTTKGGWTFINLPYIKIPSTLQTWTIHGSSFLAYTSYIELYNDFNISGTNLSGYITKEIQWFKDLCVWLKDKTGDTANTMVLGQYNLEAMNNIYLTYNPNDKNDITFDGVTSSTTGAMSIVDYITNAKNWTLS